MNNYKVPNQNELVNIQATGYLNSSVGSLSIHRNPSIYWNKLFEVMNRITFQSFFFFSNSKNLRIMMYQLEVPVFTNNQL